MPRMTEVPAKARRYQSLWSTLKQFKIAAITPSMTKDPAIFSKWVRAARKGVQKEKYHDENFRVRYPHAELSSHIDPRDETKLVFELSLGLRTTNLKDLGE